MIDTNTTGKPSPTTAADLDAFRVANPLERVTAPTKVADVGPGMWIERTQHRFEIFRFHAAELETDIVFDVRGIKAAMVAGKLDFQMFDVDLVNSIWPEHIRVSGGVEAERMAQLTAADLERPGISVFWPQNGYTTLIDGNNRLVRRWDDGLRTFRMASLRMGSAMLPYVCTPGDEQVFIERDEPSGGRADYTRLGVKVERRCK